MIVLGIKSDKPDNNGTLTKKPTSLKYKKSLADNILNHVRHQLN